MILKKAILPFAAMLLCLEAGAQRIVCDESCRLETSAEAGYAVVNPVGQSSVEMIDQAPRLETLDGKTIAVVGVSFMTSVTHPEIKRLILENYPTARVILTDEIGICGPYPAPGVRRKSKEEFQQKLKELKVDAVISGNGGCGLCTPCLLSPSDAADDLPGVDPGGRRILKKKKKKIKTQHCMIYKLT